MNPEKDPNPTQSDIIPKEWETAYLSTPNSEWNSKVDLDQPRYIQFLQYWKGLLDLGYYFLIIPFRLIKSKETGRLEIYSCRFQQILCGIFQTVILYDFVSLFLSTVLEAKSSNNITYFTSATYLGYVAYHLSITITFWLKKDIFQSVFDRLQDLKFYTEISTKRTEIGIKFISYGFCVVCFVMALTDSSIVNNLYAERSFSTFYDHLSETAQNHFLFSYTPTRNDSTATISQGQCFLAKFVTFIRLVILLPSLLLVPFLDLFVLMIPFSIWRMMCAFRKFCKNTAGSPPASTKILEKYWMIKRLIQDVNRAIGLLICCCVAVSLPYYAAWTGVTYFETDVHPITLFHVYGFFAIFSVFLTLSADINKKGTEFFSWITNPENSYEMSSKVLTSMLVDLHSNQIALKGNGFFQISYRFLGTLFGVIVTYSLITIQVQLSRKDGGHQPMKFNRTLFEDPMSCNCSRIL